MRLAAAIAEEEGFTRMSDGLFRHVHDATPAEYFRELVESALDHQRVKVGHAISFYLVNLLCGYVRIDEGSPAPLDEEPLALRLARALESAGAEQRAHLRRLGDVSLFVSGFFSDSLNRRVVDVDYYVSMGEYAYASLSRQESEAVAAVFAELSDRFQRLVDVLTEVSEHSALTSNGDLLRLYERWLRTGSRRTGQKLVERGIVPNASIGQRFLQ
jgi:hypothetical protein